MHKGVIMKMPRYTFACALLAGALAAAPAFAQTAPAHSGKTAHGTALVDSKDMTLYTFDKDTGGKSVCNGQCASNWPALAASDSAKASGKWSVITRDDGTKQWAYNGHPLYTFVKDTKAGEANGQGLANGAWKIATP
jgi:predicted lipoprotein with Yx(FWY)xxD motif